MYSLHPEQVRAARGLLDWSRSYLGEVAKLSSTTVKNFEQGDGVSISSVKQMRDAFEEAGLEFLEDGGLRRRDETVKVFKGNESTELLYQDVIHTLKKQGGSITIMTKTQAMFYQIFGVPVNKNDERLRKLNEVASIHCLASEDITTPLSLPRFHFKRLPKSLYCLTPTLIYGNKTAIVLPYNGTEYKFMIIREQGYAESNRAHFNILWNLNDSSEMPDELPKMLGIRR